MSSSKLLVETSLGLAVAYVLIKFGEFSKRNPTTLPTIPSEAKQTIITNFCVSSEKR